jgi:hypothetical protein
LQSQGRVFFCAIGHRTELYWDPSILKFYLAGIQFCTGDLDAPTEPIGTQAGTNDNSEEAFVRLFNGKDLQAGAVTKPFGPSGTIPSRAKRPRQRN